MSDEQKRERLRIQRAEEERSRINRGRRRRVDSITDDSTGTLGDGDGHIVRKPLDDE